MFVLGVTLTDKQKQKEVYPHVGPIFGYFELVSLVILLFTGILMIKTDGLYELIFSDDTSQVVELLRNKLWLVLSLVIATAIHFYVAFKSNDRERSNLENFISRGSSLFIFFANLFVLHYAIMIRSIIA
jgi:cytochrome b subunit of formate dehydrogenase